MSLLSIHIYNLENPDEHITQGNYKGYKPIAPRWMDQHPKPKEVKVKKFRTEDYKDVENEKYYEV